MNHSLFTSDVVFNTFNTVSELQTFSEALNCLSNTAVKPLELKLFFILKAQSAHVEKKVFSYSQEYSLECVYFRNSAWRNTWRDQFSAHRVKLKYL